jgi:hypothetical protein
VVTLLAPMGSQAPPPRAAAVANTSSTNENFLPSDSLLIILHGSGVCACNAFSSVVGGGLSQVTQA